jgi:hypothetical protein
VQTCDRRCADLVGLKDPSKWRKVLIIGGPIVGTIALLALGAACCMCCKRRIPRSRVPRQPTVHDPQPAPPAIAQAPRVVQTQPEVIAPAHATAPAPPPSIVRSTAPTIHSVEEGARQPSVIENAERTPGQPGVLERTAEPAAEQAPAPVVSSVPPQVVSRVPTQVVSRAPTGQL